MSRNTNNRNNSSKGSKAAVKREQPRKDSKSKRINEDNARASKVSKDIERDKCKSNANDSSWYNRSPELLRSAGSVPFANMLGGKLFKTFSVPGIMILPWCPSFGGENLIPINQAFDSMYSYIVHANSRNYNYTAPDLGLLCIAGSNVNCAISHLIRAYGITKYYQERNLYVPDTLLNAMGFDGADVRKHLSQLWFDINNLIDQTRQIWIPNKFPVFDRWSWMNSEIFTDAPGVSSQIYMYVQDRFFIYDETFSSEGGILRPLTLQSDNEGPAVDVTRNIYTVEQFVDCIQRMINALIRSEDRGMIFGDILNAYGSDGIRAMAPIPSDYVITPAYNAEVLTQIENYYSTEKTTNVIGQHDDRIVVGWYRSALDGENSTFLSNTSKLILNFHFPEQPTPEQVMIATRMMAGNYASNTGEFNWFDWESREWKTSAFVYPLTVGSELPHTPIVYDFLYTNEGYPTSRRMLIDQWYAQYESAPEGVSPKWIHFDAFDWHPFKYTTSSALIVDEGTGKVVNNAFAVEPVAVYGDYDNYTVIDWEVLRKLHRTALFSLWGVPHI